MPESAIGEPVLGLRELVGIWWAYRWQIAAITVLFAATSVAYALLATPIYRATVVLTPAASERGAAGSVGGLGSLASLAGINLEAPGSNTEEALAVLHSREFLEKFISDRNLLPQLFHRKWDAAAQRWKVAPAHVPTPAKGVRYFEEKILAHARDKKTGLITVTVDWRDREAAAAWANELVARVNEEMRSRAAANANNSMAYLEKEMLSTEIVETRNAIGRLMESQVRQRMLASVTSEYAFRTVDRALPPDVDDFASPKRIFVCVGGTLAGFLLGVMGALLHSALSGSRAIREPVA